jgi:hypothetical protein
LTGGARGCGMIGDMDTVSLPARPDTIAPDGSEVRVLVRMPRGLPVPRVWS